MHPQQEYPLDRELLLGLQLFILRNYWIRVEKTEILNTILHVALSYLFDLLLGSNILFPAESKE